MRILKYLALCLFVSFWAFAISGTIQAHTSRTIPVEHHPIIEQPIEIQMPAAKVADVPEVHYVSFTDEFAPDPIDPLVANLTEHEWAELESIAIAEAGNQDIEGIALVMWTVLNRCRNTGASVHATIFAPSQFYTAGMAGGNDKSRQARELLESGWDESEGCLYFCSTGWNYYGAEHLFKHQDHWFSK